MGTLKFNIPSVNISAQVGDKVYSVDLPVNVNVPPDQFPNTSGGYLDQQETAETVGGFYTNQNEQQTLSLIGTIKEINIGVVNSVDGVIGTEITCNYQGSQLALDLPDYGHTFMFFVKDSTINSSAMPGYYASAMLECNSKSKAEIFAISCNTEESSK